MGRPILRSLSEQVEPGRVALVLIDVQNDFCSERGAIARVFGVNMARVQGAVPRMNALLRGARWAGVPVVYVRAELHADHLHPNMRLAQDPFIGPDGRIGLIAEGSWGSELYPDLLAPLPGERVIVKRCYDAFEDTALDLHLRSLGVETLVLGGIAANVCVETTARHGFMKGYYIVVTSDATEAFTQEEYEGALHNIRTYFGKVATGEEILACWGQVPATASR